MVFVGVYLTNVISNTFPFKSHCARLSTVRTTLTEWLLLHSSDKDEVKFVLSKPYSSTALSMRKFS